jgi:ABC-2 type transport system ATP-binding protein
MEEAAELSDHIAIMDKGRIIAYGTHDELIKLVGRETRIDITINAEGGRVLEAWRSTEGVARIDALDGTLTALVDDSNRVLPRLFDAASKVGVRIMSVDIQEPNLETVFLHLTGRALRD